MSHVGLGSSYATLGQFDSAVPEFQKAVALKPNLPVPQHMLAQAQLGAGRFRDAQATYSKLLEQFPDDARARAGLNFAGQQAH
jgi:Flp pilus assembly protein TadD